MTARATSAGEAAGSARFRRLHGLHARLLDIDSDGDLDLLAFRLQQGSVPPAGKALAGHEQRLPEQPRRDLYGRGRRVRPRSARHAGGRGRGRRFRQRRDLDLVIFPANGKKPMAWVNDRAGKHHLLDAAATGLDVRDVISATSGDPNKDGKRDLLVFAKDGVHLFINRGGFRFEEHKDFREPFRRPGRHAAGSSPTWATTAAWTS